MFLYIFEKRGDRKYIAQPALSGWNNSLSG
jgi:hypothetical protein